VQWNLLFTISALSPSKKRKDAAGLRFSVILLRPKPQQTGLQGVRLNGEAVTTTSKDTEKAQALVNEARARAIQVECAGATEH
jgi:hypothetical protein